MGVATTRAPHGLGPPNPTKKLADWVDLLGQLLSRNVIFEIFMDEPPLIYSDIVRITNLRITEVILENISHHVKKLLELHSIRLVFIVLKNKYT